MVQERGFYTPRRSRLPILVNHAVSTASANEPLYRHQASWRPPTLNPHFLSPSCLFPTPPHQLPLRLSLCEAFLKVFWTKSGRGRYIISKPSTAAVAAWRRRRLFDRFWKLGSSRCEGGDDFSGGFAHGFTNLPFALLGNVKQDGHANCTSKAS